MASLAAIMIRFSMVRRDLRRYQRMVRILRGARCESPRRQTLSSVCSWLVTSDYVVDETLTLFRARGENQHALNFGIEVIDDSCLRPGGGD
jgi:hypothetical protein